MIMNSKDMKSVIYLQNILCKLRKLLKLFKIIELSLLMYRQVKR